MTKNLHIDTQAMRAKILDLAIQGKLTDQRAEDGNAQDLLKEIQAEKEKLIKEKKIKKEKHLPEITEEEKPFEIPDRWEWVRLGDIVSKAIKRGKSPKYSTTGDVLVFAQKCNTKPGRINLELAKKLDLSTLKKYSEEEFMLSGDIVINSTGNGTMGRVGFFRDKDNPYNLKIVPDSHVTTIRVLHDLIDSQYIFYFLKKLQPKLESSGDGSTNQKELKAIIVASICIPLPPLAEQNRIVAKVSALFAQLDAIDKAYGEYQELQQAMKSKLLDLAIQGKLTDQRAEDGNAQDLLKEIQAEKEKLIKEKKIKKEKPLPAITEEEKPFEIPKNWEWVRLGDLGAPIQYPFADGPFGSNLKKEHYTTNREVRIIQLSNIGENGWRDENVKYTTFEHLKLISRSEVDPGDIVIAKMMPAGRAIIVPDKDPKYVLSSDAVKFVPNKHLYLPFVINCINSPVFQNQVTANVQGTTRKRTSLSKLKNCLLPIPPLAEQKRIVSKLDKLLSLEI